LLLEQMWIVSSFSRWENHYRHRIAAATKVHTDHVQSDLFGDLRHRRIDVIHHDAVARHKHSGRTVVLPRIPEGDVVRMTDEDFVIASENFDVRIVPPSHASADTSDEEQ
jgi:hypothetical protein